MKSPSPPRKIGLITVKMSYSLIPSALFCLRESRSIRRKPYNIMDIDIDIQTADGGIRG